MADKDSLKTKAQEAVKEIKKKQQANKGLNKKAADALHKHIQTKNVKKLMTTGGAYKKRAPIKVVNKTTSAHPGGGSYGYKFYKDGGRTNLLEELGRVEGESSNRNRRAEVSRIHGELNRGYKKGGRAGYKHGGAAKRGQGCEIKS